MPHFSFSNCGPSDFDTSDPPDVLNDPMEEDRDMEFSMVMDACEHLLAPGEPG